MARARSAARFVRLELSVFEKTAASLLLRTVRWRYNFGFYRLSRDDVLKGKAAMPPKGGNLTLSNLGVRAALDYMLGAKQNRGQTTVFLSPASPISLARP